MSFDLIVRNATLPDGRTGLDIAVEGGGIAAVEATHRGAEAGRDRRRRRHLVSPPFVDCHFHMDATLSLGLPRLNESGTLLEGIALWGELKPLLTARGGGRAGAALLRPGGRAGPARDPQPRRHLRRPAARRRGAARGEARRSRPISTCSSSPFRRTATTARPTRRENLERALDLGVDVVGGIPHFERTMADGAASRAGAVRDRGGARPAGRHALRRDRRPAVAPHRDAGLRDAAPRACRAASPARTSPPCTRMDNYYVSKLLPLIAEAGVARDRQPADQHHAAGPPRHLSEAPRHDPRAGDAGGRHQRRLRPRLRDGPLVLARLRPTCSTSRTWALHVGQMTSREAMRCCFDAVTTNAGRDHGPRGLRPRVGCNADFVLLQAADPIEAIRLRATPAASSCAAAR